MSTRRIPAALTVTITLAAGTLWGIHASPGERGDPASDRTRVLETYGDLPHPFEANRGQMDDRVRYLARGDGYSVSLTPSGATFVLSAPGLAPGVSGPVQPQAVVGMELVGAGRPSAFEGRGRLPGILNYFEGSDPAGWHTGIPTYERVRYRDVYPGTDLVFRGSGSGLEYDFVLAPGADTSEIGLRFAWANGVRLNTEGDLVIGTPVGDLLHRAPTVYQLVGGERALIDGRFVLDAGRVGFEVGTYDTALPLVIDPVVMVYSTFLGGSDVDNPFDIAVDTGGAAYVTGYTADAATDYPTTPGAYEASHNGSTDAFVTKLAPDGSSLIYSTFLGGSSTDYGFDIAVDTAGSAFVTGSTYDGVTDYPTTPGAYDGMHNGSNDAFVTKLAPSGASLMYSTFLGGNGGDIGFGLAIDATGSAYVTGETTDDTMDYPTTPGAYDEMHNGAQDAFATKLAPSGASLAYSTFLGGIGSDQGIGVAVDPAGSAYLTGRTNDAATDYPTTPGAYDDMHNGGSDAFATKLTPAGASLAYSTFLGGTLADSGYSIAVDPGGSAFVTGQTQNGATDYPTTPGAFDETHNGALMDVDGFVTKLAPSGASLSYSTFLGGEGFDAGRGIVVSAAGAAYVAARASDATTDYPTTPGAFDTTHNGMSDAVVTVLDATGSALTYSTFLGGSSIDIGWGVAVDTAGAIYLTGETFFGAADYPATPGAFDITQNGMNDGFVTKLADPGTCRTKPVTILGTLSADSLVGTTGADVFSGLAGDDILMGLSGKDTICGGDGNDTANGGGAKDAVSGGPGNDTVKGRAGADRLFGDDGKDRLKGGGGGDKLNGGRGKDTCAGGGGEDKASKCEKERSVP